METKCDQCQIEIVEDLEVINDAGVFCQSCMDKNFVEGALNAGIPLSFIEGKTKLSDHFSREYIDWKCNRGVSRDSHN